MKVIFGTDAIKFPLTGIGRYAFELANHLAGSPEISELLYLRGNTLSTHVPIAKEAHSSAEGIKHFLKKNVWHLSSTALPHHGLKQMFLENTKMQYIMGRIFIYPESWAVCSHFS